MSGLGLFGFQQLDHFKSGLVRGVVKCVYFINKEIVEKIGKVFECSVSSGEANSNFDVVIKVGEDFANRF